MDRERVAAILYELILRWDRDLDRTWDDCPEEFKEGWRKRADELISLLPPLDKYRKVLAAFVDGVYEFDDNNDSAKSEVIGHWLREARALLTEPSPASTRSHGGSSR